MVPKRKKQKPPSTTSTPIGTPIVFSDASGKSGGFHLQSPIGQNSTAFSDVSMQSEFTLQSPTLKLAPPVHNVTMQTEFTLPVTNNIYQLPNSRTNSPVPFFIPPTTPSTYPITSPRKIQNNTFADHTKMRLPGNMADLADFLDPE